MELAVTVVQDDGVWELLGVVKTHAAGRDIADAWWSLRRERGCPATRKMLALAPFDGQLPDFGSVLMRLDGTC